MAGKNTERKQIIESKIAAAHGIEAVSRNLREAQILCQSLPVNRKGAAGERSRSQWARVGRIGRKFETLKVVKKCFRMREQEMREQNWLSRLHVRHARY